MVQRPGCSLAHTGPLSQPHSPQQATSPQGHGPPLGPLCLAGAGPARLVLPSHICAVGDPLPPNTFLHSAGNNILFVRLFLLFAKPTLKSQPVLQPSCISPSLVASANVISSSRPITQTANGNTDELRPWTDPCTQHCGTEQLQPFIRYFYCIFQVFSRFHPAA